MNVSGPIAVLIAADATANGIMGGRVYPNVLKQETTYPAAAVTLVSNSPTNTKSQASDLDIITVQVDVYGETYTSAANAAAAIRTALDYQSGTVNLTGGGSVVVRHIEYKGQQDGFTDNAELHRIINTYTLSIEV